MVGQWTGVFSFVTGAAQAADRGYFALVSDELAAQKLEHTFFLAWEGGQWRGNKGPNSWSVVSMCVSRKPLVQGLALGTWGEVLAIDANGFREERIGSGKDSPSARGPMRALRSIAGTAYAAGMNRQVYRRDAPGRWAAIDRGARPPAGDKTIVGFEALDGFAPGEIYAVGWDGAIWRYDGSLWSELDSPTNVVLTCVCCAGDGNVYAGGRRGLLLRGRDWQWEVVNQADTAEDFWSLAWFRNKLYLATMRAVYTLEQDGLRQVDMQADDPITCFHLSSAEDTLWSIGSKDVMAFDGTAWTRID
jgi:hypothetical protein